MGDKAPLEPVCGYNQEQEMVDYHYADPYVCSYAGPSVFASADYWRSHRSDAPVLCFFGIVLGDSIRFRHP